MWDFFLHAAVVLNVCVCVCGTVELRGEGEVCVSQAKWMDGRRTDGGRTEDGGRTVDGLRTEDIHVCRRAGTRLLPYVTH